jgi:hypothetical protein
VNRVLVLLGRCILVLFGYVFGALAASAFLNLVIIGLLDFTPEELPWALTGSTLVSVPFVAMVIANVAFVPAMAAILIAEILGKRDWLFHTLAGAVVAAIVAGFLGQDSIEGGRAIADPYFTVVLIGGGLVGGIAYWTIAGRYAGAWRD